MTYDARLFALVHTGNPGDVEYYLEACPKGCSVLELGCGYGRITRPLLGNKAHVTALDNDEGMLAILNKNTRNTNEDELARLEVVLGDMRLFELNKHFDRVIIPYNGLLCLLTDEDVTGCLSRASAHLADGGEIVFDIYNASLSDSPDDDDDAFEHLVTVSDGEDLVLVFERILPHFDPRRLDTAYRHIITDKSGRKRDVTYVIEQRCIYREDLNSLLDKAGLEAVSVTGDFGDSRVSRDTEQIVVRAAVSRRPGHKT